MLQRGRGLSAAEYGQPLPPLGAGGDAAATEPRPLGRGIPRRVGDGLAEHLAATEPRPLGRGIPKEGRPAAEAGGAATEPRPLGRGIRFGVTPTTGFSASCNGAAASRPRNTPQRTPT